MSASRGRVTREEYQQKSFKSQRYETEPENSNRQKNSSFTKNKQNQFGKSNDHAIRPEHSNYRDKKERSPTENRSNRPYSEKQRTQSQPSFNKNKTEKFENRKSYTNDSSDKREKYSNPKFNDLKSPNDNRRQKGASFQTTESNDDRKSSYEKKNRNQIKNDFKQELQRNQKITIRPTKIQENEIKGKLKKPIKSFEKDDRTRKNNR